MTYILFEWRRNFKEGFTKLFARKWADFSNAVVTERGTQARLRFPYKDHHHFDYSQMKCKVLFIAGEDDTSLWPWIHAPALRRLSPERLKDFRYILYPKTGHLIEPPFAPICTHSYHKIADIIIDLGGSIPDHARAQEHSWKTILQFFRDNLVTQSNSYAYAKSSL